MRDHQKWKLAGTCTTKLTCRGFRNVSRQISRFGVLTKLHKNGIGSVVEFKSRLPAQRRHERGVNHKLSATEQRRPSTMTSISRSSTPLEGNVEVSSQQVRGNSSTSLTANSGCFAFQCEASSPQHDHVTHACGSGQGRRMDGHTAIECSNAVY